MPNRPAILGALIFTGASLTVFATVAFFERTLYSTLGLYGAYAFWTVLFFALAGGGLSVLRPKHERARFVLGFSLAFFAYAVAWIAAYFVLKGKTGEWVGSLLGSVALAAVLGVFLPRPRSFLRDAATLFIFHSAGYFLGDFLNATIGGKPGMLLWGAAYGLLFGAGLGLMIAGKRETELTHGA